MGSVTDLLDQSQTLASLEYLFGVLGGYLGS